MKAFTFAPNAQLVAALQDKHASPGEEFFGIVITQEFIDRESCNTLVRAMSEREYITLLEGLQKRGAKIGRPDHGLFFIGKKANSIARGSGRTLAKSKTRPGKGFEKMVLEETLRPLGTKAPKPPPSKQEVENDDMFGEWEDADPNAGYAQAAEHGAHQYSLEEQGQPSPQHYAEAAEHAASQFTQEQTVNSADRLRWAQQVAMQTSNESMVHRPPGNRTPRVSPDPLHPANRAGMAHKIGLDSTYATMPNGRTMAATMGHATPTRRARSNQQDQIANRVVGDLFDD